MVPRTSVAMMFSLLVVVGEQVVSTTGRPAASCHRRVWRQRPVVEVLGEGLHAKFALGPVPRMTTPAVFHRNGRAVSSDTLGSGSAARAVGCSAPRPDGTTPVR